MENFPPERCVQVQSERPARCERSISFHPARRVARSQAAGGGDVEGLGGAVISDGGRIPADVDLGKGAAVQAGRPA